MSHVTGASAHQRINLIGAQVWLGAQVTDGVLPLQASVVEHSDQSRKTVTLPPLQGLNSVQSVRL